MSHALWVLREVGPLNTRSKDSLLKATLQAPALPAIFLLFPRTRFPALPSAPFAEELPELPVLPGETGHLLPEEREPLKTACFPKQMRHNNDRAVLTRLPHPVRHNRNVCFITDISELELPKRENTYGARSTHMVSNMCLCVCVCVCVFIAFVCVCVHSCTCLLECKCIPQSARPSHSSARPCHSPCIHQAVVHHIYCALFCHCARMSQNSIMAPDITESIQWVRLVLLFADISFASSLSLVVFESDADKPDSNLQFVFMLHENNPESNRHTRSPPIDSDVSNVDLKFH